ncbi:hypothetical protein [Streptomyces zhihengii]|uniref:hypothetical protein n=1 Tax=Streptomyces zhihengii TaxID=1818004 RepID=UPI0033B06027
MRGELGGPHLRDALVPADPVGRSGVDAEGHLGEAHSGDGLGKGRVAGGEQPHRRVERHGVRRHEELVRQDGPRVDEGAHGDDRAVAQPRFLEDRRRRCHVDAPADPAAEQGGVRSDEDVVADDHRLVSGDGGGAQHGVLADRRRFPDLDAGPLGVEHRAVHHPRSRAHTDIAHEGGRRGDVGAGMDLRFPPAVPDADALRCCGHGPMLAR